MNEGDIVLTPIQQADGISKNRPAVVLRKMPGFGDFLLCGVSTQLRHEIVGFDEPINPASSDFEQSGLVTASLVRLGFLAILPDSKIMGKIGSISRVRHRRLLVNLSNYLLADSQIDENPSW